MALHVFNRLEKRSLYYSQIIFGRDTWLSYSTYLNQYLVSQITIEANGPADIVFSVTRDFYTDCGRRIPLQTLLW